MKNISLLLLFITLFNCKVNKDISKDKSLNKDWTIKALKSYKEEKIVTIKIINNSDNNLVIFDPFLKKIEKFNGEKWIKIKNPYCPCGGCPPPLETISISSTKAYIFNWNKTVTTCINNKKNREQLANGKYRVTFNYGKSETVKLFEQLIVNFQI